MTTISDEDVEKIVFEHFALAHPHEAHDACPDKFWELFSKKFPTVSRDEMVDLLKTTEG